MELWTFSTLFFFDFFEFYLLEILKATTHASNIDFLINSYYLYFIFRELLL